MAVRFAKTSLWSLTLAGAAMVASLSLLAPRPALAADDGEGDIFGSLLGAIIGVTSAPDAPINYRQRAPLVVPPTMDLPPPQSAAVPDPAWPQNPDVVAQQKASARARAYDQALADGSEDIPVLSQSQLAAHSAPIAAPNDSASDPMCGDLVNGCSPAQLWGMLSAKSTDKEDTAALVPGVDPPRQYLTDPPAGYRVATKVVKLTPSAPVQEDHSADPEAYYRDQAARSRSIDGTDTDGQ